MAEDARKPVRFSTHASLSQRLVLATLTGRAIHVSQIRASSATSPGLAAHEISLLRLLESVTNGSQIDISVTGTTLLYRPGLIVGSGGNSTAGVISRSGGVVRHELPASCERGVSYFLLALAVLAPFAKAPTNVLFTGPGVITSATTGGEGNDGAGRGGRGGGISRDDSEDEREAGLNATIMRGGGDISADTVRTAILPLYTHFGIPSSAIELRILRRSNAGPGGRGGGGEVQLVFGPGSQVRLPKTVHLLSSGRVKRIRGVAYATGVSGSNNARSIESARSVLNTLSGDVYIFSDVSNAPLVEDDAATTTAAAASGRSAGKKKKKIGLGFGLSLVAESTSGALYSADVASPPGGGVTPEDIGLRCAYQLLETVEQGGMVPLSAAPTVMTLMAMGSEDVGRINIGRSVMATEEMVGLARDLRALGASGWGFREAGGSETTASGQRIGSSSSSSSSSSSDEDGDGLEEEGRELIVSVVGRGVGNVGRKIA